MFTIQGQMNIERNIPDHDPVMQYVDPTKTIKAPHSQGNVVLFAQNAGLQCVSLSLRASLYHNMKRISNPDDLKPSLKVIKSNALLTLTF